MTYTSSVHSCDDQAARARYQALWENSPQRSSFSSLSYGEHAAAAYGLRAQLHLVQGAGRDEAGALILWRRRGPYRQALAPPFTQYSAFVLREQSQEALVHARQSPLEALLGQVELAYARASLMVRLADPRAAQWRRWRVRPLFTYRLNPGAGTKTWSAGARRTLHGHKSLYSVAERPDAAKDIVALCQASYARRGRRLPADPGALQHLIHAMTEEGQARLFVATPLASGAPEAGVAVAHDGRTADYWIAGGAPGPAMTVLLGSALEALRAAGIMTFDFVGANTPSIAEFKRRFGATLSPYYRLEKTGRLRSCLLRWAAA